MCEQRKHGSVGAGTGNCPGYPTEPRSGILDGDRWPRATHPTAQLDPALSAKRCTSVRSASLPSWRRPAFRGPRRRLDCTGDPDDLRAEPFRFVTVPTLAQCPDAESRLPAGGSVSVEVRTRSGEEGWGTLRKYAVCCGWAGSKHDDPLAGSPRLTYGASAFLDRIRCWHRPIASAPVSAGAAVIGWAPTLDPLVLLSGIAARRSLVLSRDLSSAAWGRGTLSTDRNRATSTTTTIALLVAPAASRYRFGDIWIGAHRSPELPIEPLRRSGRTALHGKEACRNPEHRTSHGSVPSGAENALSARCRALLA